MMRPFNVGVILSLAFLVVGSLAVDIVRHQRTAGISRECRHGELRDWGVLLSGGGIRATAAGYSALQALEEVKVHRDKKTTMTALEGVHTIVGISGGSWALTTAMAQDYNFKKLDNLVKKTVETQKGFGNMARFKQVRCKSSECHVQWTQELKDKVFPGFIPKPDFWKDSYSKKVDDCAAPSASVAFSVWDCPNTIPGSGKDENCRTLGYCHVTDGAKEPMMRCNDYRKEVAPATKSHKADGWAKAVPVSSLGNRRNIKATGTHLDPLDIWELMGYSSSAWSAVNSDPTVEVEPVLVGKLRNPQVALLAHASKNNVHDEAERRGHVRADPDHKKTKSNSQPHPIYPLDAKAAAVYPGIQPIDKDASKGLLLSDEGGYCNLGFPSLFTPESPGSYVRILAFDAGDNKDNKDDPLGVELTKCFHFHRMEPDKKQKAIEEQLRTAFDLLYKNKKLYKYVHTENGISYVCGSFEDFTTTKYDTGTFTLEYCNKDRRNLVIAMTEVEGNIIYYFPIRGSDNVYIPDEFPTVKVTVGKILKFKVGEPNYFETYDQYDSVRQRLRRFYKLALCFANYDADDRCEKYKFKVDNDEKQSHLTDRFKPGKKK